MKTRARMILRTVQSLHLRGYQRLRILPGVSPSGTHWRCSISPASNDSALATANAANFSTASEFPFDWLDVSTTNPDQLAEAFIARFPAVANKGKGSDWLYAGWFVELLHLTYPTRLPIAYADWDLPTDSWATLNDNVRIPLPPLHKRGD